MRRAQNRGPRRTRIILCATFAVGLSCAHAWNPATIVGPNDLKTQPFPLAVQVYQNGDFHNFTVIFGMHKDTGNLPLDVHLRLWVARQGGDGLEELGVVTLRSEGGRPESARDPAGTNRVVVRFSLHRRMCIWPSNLSFVYQPLTLEGQRPHYTLWLRDFTGEGETRTEAPQ